MTTTWSQTINWKQSGLLYDFCYSYVTSVKPWECNNCLFNYFPGIKKKRNQTALFPEVKEYWRFRSCIFISSEIHLYYFYCWCLNFRNQRKIVGRRSNVVIFFPFLVLVLFENPRFPSAWHSGGARCHCVPCHLTTGVSNITVII